ncbi:GNAT family N-acetyltransferase [Streptomyces sp. NPDC017993]|uniref:GNAT family N-acetyltransferase n=1 Tax=Streptomyces sp. NPDC017993 TaxID=3365027 RepID=UPI0037A0D6F9
MAHRAHVAQLASERAAYERAAPPATRLVSTTGGAAVGSQTPRLRCFVAELNDGEIIGYATCAPEVSTWDGAEYLHMACLLLRDGHRALKVGPLLVEAVVAEARELELGQVQWRTPPWNADAIRSLRPAGGTGEGEAAVPTVSRLNSRAASLRDREYNWPVWRES